MTPPLSSTSKLRGKRVLITAGAQGIGLATTRALIAAGCDIFVHYHSSAKDAEALITEGIAAGVRVGCASADLKKAAPCEKIVAEAVAFLGGLDVLINNAGSLVARRSFDDADDAFWTEVMGLNFESLRRVTRASAPHLKNAALAHGGASIVNVASLAGRKGGHPGSLAYATSKGAVITFTRALASEFGPQGVRVNAVAPGLILGTSFHSTHTSAESVQMSISGIPLARAGTPEDVARAVVFLAGEFDGFITGATLDINGGVFVS
jgi:3-oxoacyl-[acyl-carrier protein] reductase